MDNLTAIERETVINMNDGEDKVYISTAQRKIMSQLNKYCEAYPDSWKIIKDYGEVKFYECLDKKHFKISFRPKKMLSDEEIQKRRERMQKMRNKN